MKRLGIGSFRSGILILLIGAAAYWIVDALLCLGFARFGSGPTCSTFDPVMSAYRTLMKWAKYRHDELQALSGVAISIFTFLLAIGSYRLWRHGVRLARMQQRDTEAALMAARQAAEAAVRSAEAARAAIVAGRRPWVQILAAVPAAEIAAGGTSATMRLDLRVKNVGNSPALEVKVHAEMRTDGSLADSLTEPDVVSPGPTLFPAQEASLTCRVTLPATHAEAIRRRLAVDPAAFATPGDAPPLYLAAAAFYSTPLDDRRRRTEACFAFLHAAASPSASAPDPRSAVSAQGAAIGGPLERLVSGPHSVT